MVYNPINNELEWYNYSNKKQKIHPKKHIFAHAHVRSKLAPTLSKIGCTEQSSILSVGCGTGEDGEYLQEVTKRIIGIDISHQALAIFNKRGFEGVLGNVETLPFRDNSFDFVICSGILHHLIGQGNLINFIKEFERVVKPGGYLVALEPNLFNHSGLLMNIFNTIKPGITGLVPHERALSPLYLIRIFNVYFNNVNGLSATYVWNRFPLFINKLIASYEETIRQIRPFSYFGWFIIVYGQKPFADNR